MSEDINNTGNSQPEAVAPVAPQESVSFINTLSDELKGESSLQDFKDVNGLAKSYVNAQKMVGSSIRIPTPDASQEVIDSFYDKVTAVDGVIRVNKDDLSSVYNQLGRPENVDGYKVDVEGELNAEAVTGFKNIAHDIGLNNDQLNKIVEFDQARSEAMLNQSNTHKESNQALLKDAWGNDYDNRLQGAKATLETFAEKYPDAVKEIATTSIGSNPVVAMLLSELHGSYSEKGIIPKQNSISYGTSRDDALATIQDITTNLQHAAHNAAAPGHREAAAKLSKAYQIAYPEDQ